MRPEEACAPTPERNHFERLADAVADIHAARAVGRAASSRGGRVVAEGLALPVGGWAVVRRADGTPAEGEATGVSPEGAELELVDPADGVVAGAAVEFGGRAPVARLSGSLLGRTIDALCRPVDGRGPFAGAIPVPLSNSSGRRPRATRTLVRGGCAADRAAFLARAAACHDGPIVALLVGGSPASHERFAAMLGDAAARTARVVEPGSPSRARSWRAARVAGALAGFLSEEECRPALVVADWRVPVATPAGLWLDSVALWSFGARCRVDADAFDDETAVDAKREVA